MAGRFNQFLCLGALAQAVLAFNCSISPIYVDIHYRIVHGTNVFQYGSFIGAGSPGQNQSLFPSLRQNETSVAFVDYCDDSSLPNCIDATRGNFDPSQSSSWSQDTEFTSLDSSPVGNRSIYGTDKLHLYTHYIETEPASESVINHFPIEVATSGDVSPGIVGLGASSTVLQSLFNQKLIAGKSVSLYIGTAFDRAGGAINGSSTYGGYDQGRFVGDVHSYPMDITDPHPLNITVKDIIINDASGNVSLFDSKKFPDLGSDSGAFKARITTDQYPMSLPYQITENFKSLLEGEESDHEDGSLRLKKPFKGSMSIVLSDGFTVTLPSETVYNETGLSPVGARDKDSTDDYFLSLPWLSQVYLMMDYDAWTFHLAQAIVTSEFITPVTLCPKSVPVVYQKPETSDFAAKGYTGAVIGGVIGGLAAIAFTICAFVFLSKRRAIKAEKKAEEAAAARVKSANMQFDISEDGSTADPQEKGSQKKWFGRK